MGRAWNKPRDIAFPVDEAAVGDINECFDLLFLALRNGALGTGVLPVGNGGTGIGDVPAGALLVGQGTALLAVLLDIETGNVLLSGGVGVAPAYGKVGLTTHVSGILPIENGGTAADNAQDAFDNLSPLTAKGDVLSHNGITNVAVPVGTDGFTLVADSLEAAGVKWAQGGGTHEILEEAVHTDADTQTRQLGDLITAQGPTTLEAAWIDGEWAGLLPSGTDTTGLDYWMDGLPVESTGGGLSGPDVKWRRLGIGDANQVLASNGTTVEWRDAGIATEVIGTAQPKVRVYATSSVSIASGAGVDDANGGTAIDFDAESFDTDSFHTGSSSQLIVPSGKGGTYLIVAQASWSTSAAGRKACWIYKNGTVRLGVDEVNGDDGGLNLSHTAVCFAVLAAADYVELHVRQDSGGAISAIGSANADLCSLSMYKLP